MSVPKPACRIVDGKLYRAAGKYLHGWREYSHDLELDLYTLIPLA